MLDKTISTKELESRHYPDWEQSGAFAANPQSNAQGYCIMIPPPNVTGSLHMGHALNTTLQDILIRYHRMRGMDTLWMPGTDHAGIATQMVVERQLDAEGIKRRDLGREKFLKRVWEWKAYSGGTITSQLRRLGATPDWGRERFTMDEGMSKAVITAFVKLYKDGLIYRDKRLVNWDTKFQSAISDIEVEQREVKGHLWHIQYAVEGNAAQTITIATTRPETMLGDTAIAVHPEDERYKDLIGKMAVVPIADRSIPIIADDYADPEHGSGAVKITPAHDFNDFEVGKRHNLPMINIFDRSAHLVHEEFIPESYRGLDRFEARKKILKELEEIEALVKAEPITHMVPHGDRSGVVIEPYLTDQWFVDTKTMAKPAIEAVKSGQTKFIPANWENTYFEWMDNIQPWCISRQLWWGHQIPAWYDADGKIYVAETEKQAQEQAGVGKQITRDEDVLDTWFSSALWPFSTLGWPELTPELNKYYPGTVLVTGFDIITFWVSRMMMMGLHFMGDVPFKEVYIHALVRDAKGQKMSKSKGNVIDPLDLIDKYGADALRFTLTAMAAQGRDLRLSEDRVEGYRNFTTKLWNAARYCEMNNAFARVGFKPESVTHTLNQWIIGEVFETQSAIDKALGAYKFNDAAGAIYQFVWGTFCDWYLEFTKPYLNASDTSPAMAEEIRATTGWVLEQILRLLNPFMPYITEELIQYVAAGEKHERILQSQWPSYAPSFLNPHAAKEIGALQKLITEIRSVRADMNVPAGAKITLLVKDAHDDTKRRLKTYDAVLKQMARLETISTDVGTIPKGSIQSVVDEATIILPVADIIDLNKEQERLKKQIAKLQDDIRKTDEKLQNQQFVANAPLEIIEEFHTRKKDALVVIEKLSNALKHLDAA